MFTLLIYPFRKIKKCLYSQAIEKTDGMILRILQVENEHARFAIEPDWKNTAKILLKSEGLERILEEGLGEITRMRGIQC